jgi:hypothetical protein
MCFAAIHLFEAPSLLGLANLHCITTKFALVQGPARRILSVTGLAWRAGATQMISFDWFTDRTSA